ncbi:MAG TPA: hypothetical protein VG826_25330 [Pirellulales bacterium]|nr:hypothetical protein [Pirellulales bacterium]
MTDSHLTTWDSFLAAYDLDQISAVPQALRLRTLHLLALFAAAVSIAAAIECPRAWQLVALADVGAASLLFALAAGREWCLRYRAGHRFPRSAFVHAAHRWEYQTVVP